MLIEQLLNAMPEDLRVWLSEKKPATGSEAGRLADEYVLARKRNRLEVPRSSSNEDTTSGRESRKCHNCGLEGHLAWNCTMTKNRHAEPGQRLERNQGERTERKCYNCNQRGHMARQCPAVLYCGRVWGLGSFESH